MQQTILITGSNRGLGLEWARQYAASGWRVHATCRYPDDAEELQQIARTHANLTLHQLDVTDDGHLRSLATELSDASIDVLLNNAGVYLEKYKPGFGLIDYGDWLQTLTVNTLGAVRVTEALVEQVACSRSRLVVAITSHMGSIAEIAAPGSYYYRSSKAALNAAMKGLSIELAGRGIGVLMLHPGWVRTRMGGPEGLLTPEQSVRGMRRLVEQFALTDNGRFYRYDGSEIPW